MKVYIEKILLIDPFSEIMKKTNLIIEKNIIQFIGDKIPEDIHYDIKIEGKNRYLFPGLIDMHTHLREPGFEYKEDIASGSLAALHGGFTTITNFPNTHPVIDSPDRIKSLLNLIEKKSLIKIIPVACITKKQKGKELVDFESLIKEGAKAFTDDGNGIQDNDIMLGVLQRIKDLNVPVLLHTEDEALARDGLINEGKKSFELNLKGIPAEAEESMIARDIILAKRTRAKIHFCHVSTAFSAKMIKLAKEENIRVSCEVTPHHLCFSEDSIHLLTDSNKKMNPPLRTEQDKECLIEYLKAGFIDAIATDHAPHSIEEKKETIQKAPFGIIGLETTLPLLYTYLVQEKRFPFYRIIESLTKNPADLLNLDYHPIKKGNKMNFVIFNTEKESFLTDDFFYSKSRNFPLIGKKLTGKVELVFYQDKIADFRENLKYIS